MTITIETLTLVLDIKREHILLSKGISLYRPPGTIHSFVTDLIQLVENVLSFVNVTRILVLGDFNLDQMLQEIVNKMHPLTQRFHLRRHSQFLIRVQSGILVLVFDSRRSQKVYWVTRHIVTILHFALTFNDHLYVQNVL